MLKQNIYQADGCMTSKRQANGNKILFSYDVFGNEWEITTTRSREKGVAAQHYHYDSRGRITGVVNGNQHTTGYDRDHWGRITKTHNPDEGKEQNTYNFAGNITSTTDANGNVITYRYNSQGKVCEIIDQAGNAEQFYYDREGRPALSIDHLRARFYNPVVGRFLQEDEYRGDGLNLYAYCRNNPVVYYDPSGYEETKNYKPEIIWPSSPHTNSTPGHWETMIDQVSDCVSSGDYDKVYANKGIKQELGKGDFSNKRSDVIGVRTDGKIDVFEVPSRTDDIGALNNRIDYSLEQMGDRAGSGTIRNIPAEYSDLPLPKTIDLPENLKYSQKPDENDKKCKG